MRKAQAGPLADLVKMAAGLQLPVARNGIRIGNREILVREGQQKPVTWSENSVQGLSAGRRLQSGVQ